MALPTLNSSTYSITVPSTGNKVKFRPYLVKEEKILLVALESEDANQIVQAMTDVIEACVEDIDISELTSFDVEYLFLVLRAKSVGESIDLKMKCQNSESCSHVLELSINTSFVLIGIVFMHTFRTKIVKKSRNENYAVLLYFRYMTQ